MYNELGLLNLFLPVIVGVVGGGGLYYKHKTPQRKHFIIACLWIYLSPLPTLYLLDNLVPSIAVSNSDFLPLTIFYFVCCTLLTIFLIRKQTRVSFFKANPDIKQENHKEAPLKYIQCPSAKFAIYSVFFAMHVGTISIFVVPNSFFPTYIIGYIIAIGYCLHVSYAWKFVRCPHCDAFVLHNVFSPMEDIKKEGKPPSVILLAVLACRKAERCYCCRGKVKLQ